MRMPTVTLQCPVRHCHRHYRRSEALFGAIVRCLRPRARTVGQGHGSDRPSNQWFDFMGRRFMGRLRADARLEFFNGYGYRGAIAKGAGVEPKRTGGEMNIAPPSDTRPAQRTSKNETKEATALTPSGGALPRVCSLSLCALLVGQSRAVCSGRSGTSCQRRCWWLSVRRTAGVRPPPPCGWCANDGSAPTRRPCRARRPGSAYRGSCLSTTSPPASSV
jgi:hypothetical protein